MESFSLLKYWKSSTDGPPPPSTAAASAATTTIVTAVSDHDSEAGGDDDGPFFDLEFALPTAEDDDNGKEGDDQVDVHNIHDAVDVDVGEEEDDEEVPNMSFSPSNDLFFKGRILEIDGQEEDVINSGNVKSFSGQFPIPVSLAKSATKFRVFLLGLKRSKSESKPQNPPQNPPQNIHRNNTSASTNTKKMFTVKFKVEEVPIFSLLTRASSNSKNNSNSNNGNEDEQSQVQQQQQQQQKLDSSVTNSEGSGDEKKNKKEVVQKYLKMVKPLYVKVSKRSQKEASEKMGQKQGLNLKVIAKKHLGKSKSAVVHSMEQNTTSSSSSKKRDDSLFQQQDGIQSAILHCKRSFNSSSTDGEEARSPVAEVAVEEGNDVVAA